MTTKTYSPKPADITHDWYLVNASDYTLGRLSTLVASYLMGKHKVRFSAHLDLGDNVIVINAAKIRLTGAKLTDKHYYHHTGYPGGIKDMTLGELLERHPARVIEHAVAGMLPKNRLADDRLRHLKVYAGAEHPHGPQSPKPLKELS